MFQEQSLVHSGREELVAIKDGDKLWAANSAKSYLDAQIEWTFGDVWGVGEEVGTNGNLGQYLQTQFSFG